MKIRIEALEAEVEVEIPREFWRYVFAGQILASMSGKPERSFERAAYDADLLLAELEKGGSDAG